MNDVERWRDVAMNLDRTGMSSRLSDVVQTTQLLPASDRLLLAKILLDSVVKDEYVELLNYEDEAGDKEVISARNAFISLHPTLVNQYRDQHVAIYRGQVVDHDEDGVALSLRIYQRFPDEFVWIAPVHAQPIEEWVIRSPRFEQLAS
ncbi:MAG: hypothetical protein KA259_01135 [Caldilineaceae bacterium]|nr:hypothetical protein [Caldilineaceae bacterium]MBP8292228.1 hypothetical protein [Caldilineaceae bacterium]